MTEKKRPKTVDGSVTKIKLTCGNAYITIGTVDGKIFEVFTNVGKAGGCTTCMLQSLTTAVTMGIRNGVPLEVFIKKMIGQGCPSMTYDEGAKYLSCVDAIGQVLKEKQEELQK